MREIKFRGKGIGSEKWVKGDLHYSRVKPHIHVPCKCYVYRDTIGQFTGLHDKNGKEIYEGDIVGYSLDDRKDIGYIGFHALSASFRVIAKHTDFGIGNRGGLHESALEVIGNLYDNPELLRIGSMSVLEIIETLAQKCELQGKYYMIGLDADGNYCGEIDPTDSYCFECAKTRVFELNEEIQRYGYELFSKKHDCPDMEIASISYAEESSPEDDDFLTCDSCGSEIDVGVLFTYADELEYWISELVDIDDLTPQDAYRINTCLTSSEAKERYPKLVEMLREKIMLL